MNILTQKHQILFYKHNILYVPSFLKLLKKKIHLSETFYVLFYWFYKRKSISLAFYTEQTCWQVRISVANFNKFNSLVEIMMVRLTRWSISPGFTLHFFFLFFLSYRKHLRNGNFHSTNISNSRQDDCVSPGIRTNSDL